jgi:hypothetical protein
MKTEAVKNQAWALRQKDKSYGQISSLLGLSKSTVSLWFKDANWSQDIKNRLIRKAADDSRKRLYHLNKVRKQRLDKNYLEAAEAARQEFFQIKKDRLFITAMSLYWGEGDKVFKNGIARISNIDAKLLKVFNDFLQKICWVSTENIRAGILLYPDLNSDACLKFWSKEVKIAESRFFKPTVIQGKHKINRLGHGVCIVSVHDKYLKKKILVWLELFRQEF